MGDADQELFASFMEETCISLYKLSINAEEEISPNTPCDCCGRRIRESEILFKTRFALQIITGCDEEDAIELVSQVHHEETKKYHANKNTEDAREFLENKFNSEGKNNES